VPLSPQLGRSSSITLEYALADCALAPMSRAFGDAALARTSRAQAGNWRNVLNPATGYAGPRTADGAFASTDPLSSTGFTDSALQSTFLMPHDVPGLAGAVEGRAALERRLDDFFVFDGVQRDPATTARQRWVGEDKVAPADQPMFHVPWMYAWLDSPWKTSPVARAWLTVYEPGPDGLPGNDDLGAGSAWYVLAALGCSRPSRPRRVRAERAAVRADDAAARPALLRPGRRARRPRAGSIGCAAVRRGRPHGPARPRGVVGRPPVAARRAADRPRAA
jgi:putative alpha-1,2-mannosidase